MSLIEWTYDFEVYNDEIDDQHKKIIELYNELYMAMSKGDAQSVLSTILAELISYSKYHFETEESILVNSSMKIVNTSLICFPPWLSSSTNYK